MSGKGVLCYSSAHAVGSLRLAQQYVTVNKRHPAKSGQSLNRRAPDVRLTGFGSSGRSKERVVRPKVGPPDALVPGIANAIAIKTKDHFHDRRALVGTLKCSC